LRASVGCIKKQELLAAVEAQLEIIAELARAEVVAIKGDTDNAWAEIDNQIELAIGKKERAIGGLREHRKEHGC
jgi:hypothetical protein